MLERLPTGGALFVAVPDVVADHQATLRRWKRWRGVVDRWPAAFVAQDGCLEVPDDADALFIGGSTEWKLSEAARRLIDDRWCHMGRVNTHRRLRLAKSWGVDSVDGSSMAMFTDTYVASFLEATHHTQLPIDQANRRGRL
jgi:hypothetical protein